MNNNAIEKKIKSILVDHKSNIASAARALGVSKVYLWDVIKGNRKAGDKLKTALLKYKGI